MNVILESEVDDNKPEREGSEKPANFVVKQKVENSVHEKNEKNSERN